MLGVRISLGAPFRDRLIGRTLDSGSNYVGSSPTPGSIRNVTMLLSKITFFFAVHVMIVLAVLAIG